MTRYTGRHLGLKMPRRAAVGRALFLIPPSSEVEDLNIIAFSLHVYTYSEFKVCSKKLQYELTIYNIPEMDGYMYSRVGITG